jgi:DNA excision repair protein ERCC-4
MSSEPHTPYALPALRSLGQLCSAQVVLIQDSREQLGLRPQFKRLPCVVRGLTTSDYSIIGFESEVGFELKRLNDFVACCMSENRERFFRECHRLRGFRFARIIVLANRSDIEQQRYRSKITPQAVLATITTIEVRWNIPVMFCETEKEAALAIERYAYFFVREYIKRVNDLVRGSREAEQPPEPPADTFT